MYRGTLCSVHPKTFEVGWKYPCGLYLTCCLNSFSACLCWGHLAVSATRVTQVPWGLLLWPPASCSPACRAEPLETKIIRRAPFLNTLAGWRSGDPCLPRAHLTAALASSPFVDWLCSLTLQGTSPLPVPPPPEPWQRYSPFSCGLCSCSCPSRPSQMPPTATPRPSPPQPWSSRSAHSGLRVPLLFASVARFAGVTFPVPGTHQMVTATLTERRPCVPFSVAKKGDISRYPEGPL